MSVILRKQHHLLQTASTCPCLKAYIAKHTYENPLIGTFLSK